MHGDFSRISHRPGKHFSRLLQQQGRVELDANQNEQAEIHHHLDRVTRRDVVGYSGYPIQNGAFKLTPTPDGDDLFISPGRFYVDGLVVEVDTTWIPFTFDATDPLLLLVAAPDPDGRPFAVGQWVELVGQDASPRRFRVTGVTSNGLGLRLALEMPDYLDPFHPAGAKPRLRRLPTVRTQPDAPEGVTLSPGAGKTVVLFLEVMERLVTEVDDPTIGEKALGGADTATRVKTVWRVLAKETGGALDCEDDVPDWPPARSGGRLTTSVTREPSTDDPCTMPPMGGFRDNENRLYRVEIHAGGDIGTATYKWSRDNGSVTYGIDGYGTPGPTDRVKLRRLGRDRRLSLQQDDWVEILSDAEELAGTPGVMVQVDRVDLVENAVILKQTVTAIAPWLRPRMRRWDGKTGPVATSGDAVELEAGVHVEFTGRAFLTGDHWAFAARVPDRSVEPLHMAAPLGVHRRHAKLGLLTLKGDAWAVHDCRKPFKPLTDACACGCTITVGDGVNSHGDFTDLQKAVDAAGPFAKVCILPGVHRLEDTVEIAKRLQLTLEGSSRAARIHAPQGKPALRIVDSDNVTLDALHVEGEGEAPVVVLTRSTRIRLRRCTLTATEPGSQRLDARHAHGHVDHDEAWPAGEDDGEERVPALVQPAPLPECPPMGNAVYAAACRQVRIEDCLLVGTPALSLQGNGLHVKRNTLAGGGLWLRDATAQASVVENQISGGKGHGVELGGLTYGDHRRPRGMRAVEIRANRIFRMGGAGVSTHTAAPRAPVTGERGTGEAAPVQPAMDTRAKDTPPDGEDWEPRPGISGRLVATLHDLDVIGNDVRECVRTAPAGESDRTQLAGIVLRVVSHARIQDNTVIGSGRAAGIRASGIVVMQGEAVEVRGNTVLDNGTNGIRGSADVEVDFTSGDHPTRDGPDRTENDIKFHVEDEDGDATSTRIGQMDGFTGLFIPDNVHIAFPEEATGVEIAVYFQKGVTVTMDGASSGTRMPGPGRGWSIFRAEGGTGATLQSDSGEFLLGWVKLGQKQETPQAGIACGRIGRAEVPDYQRKDRFIRRNKNVEADEGENATMDSGEPRAMANEPTAQPSPAPAASDGRGTASMKSRDSDSIERPTPRGRGSTVTVCDNTVVCPDGLALYLGGEGAMLVASNLLTSQGPDRSRDGGKVIAACVRIENGDARSLFEQQPDPKRDDTGDADADGVPDSQEDDPPFEQDDPAQVLFEGNVVKLDAGRRHAEAGSFGVIVACSGDVGFAGNQVRTDADNIAGGVILLGHTVRASGNRIIEPDDKGQFSLVVGSERGIILGNQATHCIIPAMGSEAVYREHNQQVGRPTRRTEYCDASWAKFRYEMSSK